METSNQANFQLLIHREPIVDTIVDEKEKVVKLIAEMPGVEKTDVKIVVEEQSCRFVCRTW